MGQRLFQAEEAAGVETRSKREQGRVWGEAEDTGEMLGRK